MSKEKLRGVCIFGGHRDGYPRSGVILKGLAKLNVPVRSCRTSAKRRHVFRYAALLTRYLRMKKDFSVVYVPEFCHKDVPLAVLLGKLSGKRVVFDPLVSRFDTKVRDWGAVAERSLQAWHNRNLDRISLRLPDLVLADTQAHADYFISRFGASIEKVKVLPVGVDDELFNANGRGPESAGDGKFRVLFFGNFLPLHGVDTIVRAAKILERIPKIQFDIIGRGQTYPDVSRLVAAENVKNVRLLPRIALEDLPASIAGASVCLGVFGKTEKARRVVANKIYQSMAMGKLVVTADTEAIREFFTDGVDIALVPAADPGALARRIEEFHADPASAERIGKNAADLIRERFSSRLIASRFVGYCEAIGG